MSQGIELIVTDPFGKYTKGERITDGAAIDAALRSNPHSCVKVATPKPKPDKTK
jgi:hypothetical protein